MARVDRNREAKGRVKLRFIEFEIDASDATLQDTLKNIAASIGRGQTPHINDPGVRQIQQTSPSADSANSAGPLENEQADYEPDPSPEPAKKSRTPPPSPNVVKDLDLKSGDVPFDEYFKGKNPSIQTQRYLVVAGWLREHRNIIDVTGDHIYTCFRFMSLNPPQDITLPLRAMKKQGWFERGQTKGSYALTQIGDNEISKLGQG